MVRVSNDYVYGHPTVMDTGVLQERKHALVRVFNGNYDMYRISWLGDGSVTIMSPANYMP